MDGFLDMASLVVAASEGIETYLLSWPLGDLEDGEAETMALALMRRGNGILLALPAMFLPEQLVAAGNEGEEGAVFGPSFKCSVPGVVEAGGVLSQTGLDVEVLVVDCLPDVLRHMRWWHSSEEIAFTFDAELPFTQPAMEVLMPRVRTWLGDFPASYTPEGFEDEPETLVAPQAKSHARRATPSAKMENQSAMPELHWLRSSRRS